MNIRPFAAALAVAGAAASAASAETMQLKYAYPGAPTALIYTHATVPWAEQVTKESEGAIEVKLFPGTTLASQQNVYDRVLNGVAEMGHMLVGFYPQQFPRSTVAMLPFESRNPHEAAVANWRLYEKGLFDAEFTKVMALALPVFTNMSIHSRSRSAPWRISRA